jgi:CDP-diacylglycerol---glycerol-3-phosphate 3-phosphatidyltransferase
MTLPMILTWGRIGLAPVFFLLYQLASGGSPFLLIGVWACFIVMEVSDLLDGHLARKFKLETELGKVLDPFADSLSRLTYFVALAGSGILPLWVLLVFIYRDVAVAYIRVLTSRQKVLMPARLSGKLKAWVYAFAGIGGILVFSLRKLAWIPEGRGAIEGAALGLFLLAAAVAIWSLADYASFFLKKFGKAS